MLKHVQISPLRGRSDSLSIRSSTSCSSSLCGSPEPPNEHQSRTPSRTSSFSSLSETIPQTTLKIYTGCLRQDIEYKTLIISWDTTCRDVVSQVLRRFKMRHRDPKLFYLSMEVTIRPSAVQTTLVLDDEARPALLQACHSKGASRFCLQIKPGGLVRVHTSVLQPMSQYKSLMISEMTTCDELLTLLLSCYNLHEPVEQFSLYEVCPIQEYQRKLHPDDLPLLAQVKRKQRGEVCHFLVRRNPNYPRRRQMLPSILEKSCSNLASESPPKPNFSNLSSLSLPIAASTLLSSSSSVTTTTTTTITTLPQKAIAMRTFMFNDVNIVKSSSLDSCQTCGNHNIDGTVSEVEKYFSEININKITMDASNVILLNNNNNNNNSINASTKPNNSKICSKCKNSFRSCEFCMKNFDGTLAIQPSMKSYNHSNSKNNNTSSTMSSSLVYNPVYNVREIRITGAAAFGVSTISINGEQNPSMVSLESDDGSDKMSNSITAFYRNKQNVSGKRLSLNLSSGSNNSSKNNSRRNSLVCEAVNTNPAQGVGNFIYI